jgi:hypothetical protein
MSGTKKAIQRMKTGPASQAASRFPQTFSQLWKTKLPARQRVLLSVLLPRDFKFGGFQIGLPSMSGAKRFDPMTAVKVTYGIVACNQKKEK